MISVGQTILILFNLQPKNYGKWDSEKYVFIFQKHATWKFILEHLQNYDSKISKINWCFQVVFRA